MREEKSGWKKKKKKMASRSKRFSLELATEFVTASDDEELAEIESSESWFDSDESNSNYLDVSEENLSGNVKPFLEVDTAQFVYIFAFCLFVEIVCLVFCLVLLRPLYFVFKLLMLFYCWKFT